MAMLALNPHWRRGTSWCAFHGFCSHTTLACDNPGGVLVQHRTGRSWSELNALHMMWQHQDADPDQLADSLQLMALTMEASFLFEKPLPFP